MKRNALCIAISAMLTPLALTILDSVEREEEATIGASEQAVLVPPPVFDWD